MRRWLQWINCFHLVVNHQQPKTQIPFLQNSVISGNQFLKWSFWPILFSLLKFRKPFNISELSNFFILFIRTATLLTVFKLLTQIFGSFPLEFQFASSECVLSNLALIGFLHYMQKQILSEYHSSFLLTIFVIFSLILFYCRN